MTLTVRQVHWKNRDYSEINALKNRAFPKIEQIPGWLLLLLALRKSVNYRAFYDSERFCGLLYTAETDKMVFVLFLAVNDKLRSRGYGSAILEWLKEQAAGKTVCLNIEDPYTEAENREQRLKRLAFYVRNGFHETGWEHEDKKEGYLILSSKEPFLQEEYLETMKILGCGFYHAEIRQRGEAQ